VGARFSAPVQIAPGAHAVSNTMGSGYFSGVNQPGSGVDNPHHPAPRLRKDKSYISTHLLGIRGLL